MRAFANLALAAACACGWAAGPATYGVVGDDPGPWPRILGSVGFQSGAAGNSGVFVVRAGEPARSSDWLPRVAAGAFLILEGDSELARSLGFRATARRVETVSVEDSLNPSLAIVWERSAAAPVYEIPREAKVLALERWTRAPLVAGLRHGRGAILWMAIPPGDRGYERFPYLLHHLSGLGLSPPFRSNRLWAFYDSSYRLRADLDYLAARWNQAGIRGLHVAAWHFYEPDPGQDEHLNRLIESCHRQGILVYAWLELPHVSEKFWSDHPAWREKTALLQDAHLDWRKLMNLANQECFAQASAGVARLLERFDWDGVNLAELYFESLQGHGNPSRFTPMNDDVRREFRDHGGFDPLELFDKSSSRHFSLNQSGLRMFLAFRAALARRMQERWLGELESVRRSKPDLEMVLTHVDDRFDPRMRDAIGADSASVLPLLGRYDFTFLIEDPATVWHLGPERYQQIAAKYGLLTNQHGRLAIDINITERYQEVYPTKQQTGTELFQLVSQASRVFPRVALYSENSILPADVPWLASAAAAVGLCERNGEQVVIDSPHGLGVHWRGAALVDGRPWPAGDGETVWVPAGRHTLGTASGEPQVRLLDLNGELTGAASLDRGLEFAYTSSARAFAALNRRPLRVEIDGVPTRLRTEDAAGRVTLWLPRGQHVVVVEVD
jgi:hypothetical protein